MSGFIYYISGATEGAATDTKMIQAAGLGHALGGPDAAPFARVVTVIANRKNVDAQFLKYDPKQTTQTWKRIKAPDPVAKTPGVWVGYTNASPPTPADLIRQKGLKGHQVTLLDGAAWWVPAAISWADDDDSLAWLGALPRRSTIDDVTGEWVEGDIIAKYKFLWTIAEQWMTSRDGALVTDNTDGTASFAMTYTQFLDDAISALAFNYHIGRHECDVLGLLNTAEAMAVLDAVIDLPTFEAWTRTPGATGANVPPEVGAEAVPDGSPMLDGPAVTPQDTVQPVPT